MTGPPVTQKSCDYFFKQLDNNAAPGWHLRKDFYAGKGTRVQTEGDHAYCNIAVTNPKIHQHIGPSYSPWVQGSILDTGTFRNNLQLDVPLRSPEAVKKWIKDVKTCGCKGFEAHLHWGRTEEDHGWSKLKEVGEIPRFESQYNQLVKLQGKPTAIHARAWCDRDKRRCVVTRALKVKP